MQTQSLIKQSIDRLEHWLIKNEYKGYEPFDGLSSKKLRALSFNNPMALRVLQQGVRRIPINIRNAVGIVPQKNAKGMSFIGSGYLKLYELTKNEYYLERARHCFDYVIDNYSRGYSGHCWGNTFDYISRAFYLPKGSPTIVWTALIGIQLIEAYRVLRDLRYLKVIRSIGDFILNDIPLILEDDKTCLSYVTFTRQAVHNANLLGARALAGIYKETGREECKNLCIKCTDYSASWQMSDGSWYYGEENKYHWIDNWHTAYNLDAIKGVQDELGINDYKEVLTKGFLFYINNFFGKSGEPNYYSDRAYKYDIQSAAQSIETMLNFNELFPDFYLTNRALQTAFWTIENMQDKDGYFYLWRNRYFINKTPTLHWGNGTMMRALTALLSKLHKNNPPEVKREYEY